MLNYSINFESTKGGETIKLGNRIGPIEIPIPLPGDEIILSAETSTGKGFSGNCFRVIKRRFHQDEDFKQVSTPITGVVGHIGEVTLVLEIVQ